MSRFLHLELIGQFLGHLFGGVCMFVGLLIGGLATKQAVLFFAPLMGGDSPSTHIALEVLEAIFLWADVFFLSWWCVFSTFKACQGLCKTED